MTAPVFFVDAGALACAPIVIDGPEGHHAATVRRLRVGEVLRVSDGEGRYADGVVAEVGRARVVVDVRDRGEQPPPDPRVVVVQALAKGGRDEDAVEMLTELGVDEFVPWAAARSVARWSDRAAQRWQATARAAAKQSRRVWLPVVAEVANSEAVASRVSRASLAIVLHESAVDALTATDVPKEGDVVVVVGPEGGIDDAELATLAAAGARVCRLGPNVLRTSTAGAAAVSVLSAQRRWS